MALYAYRAIDEGAHMLTGKLMARDEAELERQLGMQGLTLIDVESGGGFNLKSLIGLRLKDQELLDFTYLLKLIVTSGISLLTGLNDVVRGHANKNLLAASRLLQEGVESGMSLSDVMQEHPELFPGYYMQMVRAGEVSGSLEQSLSYLMTYLEWQISFKKSVRSSLTYPAIIASFMLVLVAVLFIFVFPGLIKLLTSLGAEPPLPTRILMAISTVAGKHGVAAGGVLVAGGVALRLWMRTYQGRKSVDGLLLMLPLLGDVVRKISLSRYFKQLHTLYSSGLNIERTFATAAESVSNIVIAERLNEITLSVLTGDNISQAMHKTEAIPALVVDMVALAEKTGNLESALFRATEILDREVSETVKKVFSYVEPLIILIMGILVLVVLLSVFLPIYKVIGQIRVR